MSNVIVRITGAEHDEMLAAHKAGAIVERGGMRFKTIEYSAFQHDDGPIGFFTLVEVEDGEVDVKSHVHDVRTGRRPRADPVPGAGTARGRAGMTILTISTVSSPARRAPVD